MQLLNDKNDIPYANKRGDSRIRWLVEAGAVPIQNIGGNAEGFFFGYQVPIEAYRSLIHGFPLLRDQPEDRIQLTRLEDVLSRIRSEQLQVLSPRTWVIPVDVALPVDLAFPLFVRTSTSSWKRGGQISKVRNLKQLQDECELLRRAFRWDATILAREWINFSVAGHWRYGDVPRELRVWVVDKVPYAWSFHYLNVVPEPRGFPPNDLEFERIKDASRGIGSVFSSRLIAADFACDTCGRWHFLEAGPGACSGTAHESVFKAVATKLVGQQLDLQFNTTGGLL